MPQGGPKPLAFLSMIVLLFSRLLWLLHVQFNSVLGVLGSRVPILKVSGLVFAYILV